MNWSKLPLSRACFRLVIVRFYRIMKGDVDISDQKGPRSSITWTDALILGGAVLGILLGTALISFRASVVLGVSVLVFVVYKLLTTKA